MSTSPTNPKVDAYFNKLKKWREEAQLLRKILLGCDLAEEFKWNKPCYTFQETNVVVVLPLKEYCALLLCKGALLKDTDGILVKTGENAEVGRQVRFTDVREITRIKPVLKTYISQAIEVEKAGLKVVTKKVTDLKLPQELQNRLDKDPAFKSAFNALTPGRQRAYIFHFAAPKQSKTRESRIDKYTPQILNGKGLNERNDR